MTANDMAGASAPAIEIDREAASSWAAFKHLRVLNDENAEVVDKMDAALAYAGLVAHLDEDGIVEMAGGQSAQISDVMQVVAAIIAEASPKN